jgi:hypothetical protein
MCSIFMSSHRGVYSRGIYSISKSQTSVAFFIQFACYNLDSYTP